MGAFHLSKWYLDCVTDDGSALIGYWARLRWGALRLDYAAALIAHPGAEPRQISSLRSPGAPALQGTECTWICEPLRLAGRWAADAPSVEQELLQTEHGGITWRCHQPRSRAEIRLGDSERFSGLGYVEHLELTIPPWRLPFDTLYWGRFLSPDHALTWIQWPGHSFAVLNGVIYGDAEVSEQGVRLPGAELVYGPGRPLREGHLAATVLDVVPGLVSLLPAKFRRAHEAKRVGPAELRFEQGRPPSEGQSIYEVVTW